MPRPAICVAQSSWLDLVCDDLVARITKWRST
jgi:hypothetical protein